MFSIFIDTLELTIGIQKWVRGITFTYCFALISAIFYDDVDYVIDLKLLHEVLFYTLYWLFTQTAT